MAISDPCPCQGQLGVSGHNHTRPAIDLRKGWYPWRRPAETLRSETQRLRQVEAAHSSPPADVAAQCLIWTLPPEPEFLRRAWLARQAAHRDEDNAGREDHEGGTTGSETAEQIVALFHTQLSCHSSWDAGAGHRAEGRSVRSLVERGQPRRRPTRGNLLAGGVARRMVGGAKLKTDVTIAPGPYAQVV